MNAKHVDNAAETPQLPLALLSLTFFMLATCSGHVMVMPNG